MYVYCIHTYMCMCVFVHPIHIIRMQPLLSCKLRRSTITRKPPGLSRRRWRAQLFSLWAPPIHHCFDWLLTKTWIAVMGKHGFILYILDLFIYIYLFIIFIHACIKPTPLFSKNAMFSCPMPLENLQATFITDWFLAQTISLRSLFAIWLPLSEQLTWEMMCHVSSITEQSALPRSSYCSIYSDCSETVQVVYPAKLSGSAAVLPFLIWHT